MAHCRRDDKGVKTVKQFALGLTLEHLKSTFLYCLTVCSAAVVGCYTVQNGKDRVIYLKNVNFSSRKSFEDGYSKILPHKFNPNLFLLVLFCSLFCFSLISVCVLFDLGWLIR